METSGHYVIVGKYVAIRDMHERKWHLYTTSPRTGIEVLLTKIGSYDHLRDATDKAESLS